MTETIQLADKGFSKAFVKMLSIHKAVTLIWWEFFLKKNLIKFPELKNTIHEKILGRTQQ